LAGAALPEILSSMATKKTESKATLYARLGGIYSIAAVIDDFIDRVIDSPLLNANPAVYEGHLRISRAGFKYLVTELVGFASGGPQQYSGRSMLTAHKHLGITEREWKELVRLFQLTLDKFKIPAVEQGELCAIVMSTKPDIVRSVAPAARNPPKAAAKSGVKTKPKIVAGKAKRVKQSAAKPG
jgi:hemoglobin